MLATILGLDPVFGNLTERDIVALTMYGEARGEEVEGRIAVGCVLRNRLESGRWGTTYSAVCLARLQFSCWNTNDPNRGVLLDQAHKMIAGAPVSPVLSECYWIADGVMSGAAGRRVYAATHYYASWMPSPPAWAVGAKMAARVGSHLFFEGVK